MMKNYKGLFYGLLLLANICLAYGEASAAEIEKVGQEVIYEYEGRDVTWTVPISGYYEIVCSGGKGHIGNQFHQASNVGKYGDSIKGTVLLFEGTTLVIHVGSGATGYENANGWDDGGIGISQNVNGNVLKSGAGGGSSYISYQGTNIIEAKGGDGGSVSYGNVTVDGGLGGGINRTNNASFGDISWVELAPGITYTEENYRLQDGKIEIKLVKKWPLNVRGVPIKHILIDGVDVTDFTLNGMQIWRK